MHAPGPTEGTPPVRPAGRGAPETYADYNRTTRRGRGSPTRDGLRECDRHGPRPVHLDLYTSDRDGHIERLLKLGATRPDNWPYPEEHSFVVLRDTEGNEFCVITAPTRPAQTTGTSTTTA
ncbi:VOC family protein [Kribbella sp. NPDC000426]|uniref:VOC family protein n=1 Tax=Kribbella sp. NPDC000426 TaxID=3154255 RepID=UPI00331F676F